MRLCTSICVYACLFTHRVLAGKLTKTCIKMANFNTCLYIHAYMQVLAGTQSEIKTAAKSINFYVDI